LGMVSIGERFLRSSPNSPISTPSEENTLKGNLGRYSDSSEMSGKLGYATASATAITNNTESAPAATSPKPHSTMRQSHVSHVGRLEGGGGADLGVGPEGRFFSGMESWEVDAHYKNAPPPHGPQKCLKTQVLEFVT